MLIEHLDVLIVGAGLSGIGAACMLRRHCPRKHFALLEARTQLGGTWDLFRYPGMRSDSDMFSLGYSFRPWAGAQGLADGAAILRYIQETAQQFGIDREIRYHHRVVRASWSTLASCWKLEVERGEERHRVHFTCRFLFTCTGYYRYDQGYSPAFRGSERFQGTIIHPQFWPASHDHAGKRIVVIGSGATAVTLIPALAKSAAQVTMLQRSPGYVAAQPTQDRLTQLIQHLPAPVAYRVNRWRSVLFGFGFYQACKHFPAMMRALLLRGVRGALGADYDVTTHFTPRYNPWEQRLCLAPDGDLFAAIRSGRAVVCTGEIDQFTTNAIRLRDGRELAADIIVTATGLNLVLLGDIQLEVDGHAVRPADTLSYRGAMYSGVPNLAATFGYTNASWTLKCELTCRYVCRLLNYMDRRRYRVCTPVVGDDSIQPEAWMNLDSGYIQRSIDLLPKQGSRRPWRLYQNYLLDLLLYYFGALDDGAMKFS